MSVFRMHMSHCPESLYSCSFPLLKLDVRIPANLSRMLRETSILVYLLHPVVQGKLPLLGMGYHGKRAFIIVLLFSILVSLLIILLSKKIRVFKLLY